MKKLLSIAFIFGLLGCAHVPIEYATHMPLRLGMAKQEVLAVMGPPARQERYQRYGETNIDYLIYNYFSPYEKETPICFIDNKLAGWGRTYYEDHINSNDRRLK